MCERVLRAAKQLGALIRSPHTPSRRGSSLSVAHKVPCSSSHTRHTVQFLAVPHEHGAALLAAAAAFVLAIVEAAAGTVGDAGSATGIKRGSGVDVHGHGVHVARSGHVIHFPLLAIALGAFCGAGAEAGRGRGRGQQVGCESGLSLIRM